MNEIILMMLIGVLIAACISATFGFGEALLLVPLLTPLIGISQTVPLVSLLSLIINVTILIQDRHSVQFRSILPLLVTAALCVPLGIYVLSNVHSPIFKYALAVIIILFSIYNLVGKRMLTLHNDRWAWLFGAVAGTMGGAYNIAGPPVVMYASLRGWDPASFRASLQGFFAPLSVLVVIGHAVSGNYTTAIGTYFLWSLPVLIGGILLGNYFHHQIQNPNRFKKYIYGLLVVLGTALFF